MGTIILACTTLENYVTEAQRTCQTDYPVVYLDKKYHIEPARMREKYWKQ